MAEVTPPLFVKNPELNKSYTIVNDHEIEIQSGEHQYKGKLSGIRNKETVEFLLERGHEFITVKPGGTTATKPVSTGGSGGSGTPA